MIQAKEANVTPFDFQGLEIRDFTGTLLDGASFAQIMVPPGAAHPKDKSTRSDKLYVGIDGVVLFSVEGKLVSLEPTDLLVIHKGEWFEYHNASDSGATLLLVYVPSFDMESEVFLEEETEQ